MSSSIPSPDPASPFPAWATRRGEHPPASESGSAGHRDSHPCRRRTPRSPSPAASPRPCIPCARTRYVMGRVSRLRTRPLPSPRRRRPAPRNLHLPIVLTVEHMFGSANVIAAPAGRPIFDPRRPAITGGDRKPANPRNRSPARVLRSHRRSAPLDKHRQLSKARRPSESISRTGRPAPSSIRAAW